MNESNFKKAQQVLIDEIITKGYCLESAKAVRECRDLPQLIRVFKLFRGQLLGEDFPTTNYLRTYFDKHELARFGVFVDYQLAIPDYKFSCSYVVGNSHVILTLNEIAMKHIVCRDNSVVDIHAKDFSLWNVTLQNKAICHVIEQDTYAKVHFIDKR